MSDTLTEPGSLQVLKDYVALCAEKRDLDNRLDMVKERIMEMEPNVIDTMCDAGMQFTRIDGLTLYLRTDLRASAVNVDTLAAFADTSFMVKQTVNGNTLSAWVREQEQDDDGNPILPDAIKEAIKVTQKVNARTRKAG